MKVLKGLDLNAQRITSLADGSAATDAVTLQQMQAYVRGLDWKPSVRAASTANIAIASALINGLSMDGVALVTGNEVLLMNQTAQAENGIYTVVASGAAPRRADADVSAEVTSGMAVTVTEGTTNGDKAFLLTTNDPITLGTTSLNFAALGGGGSAYTAGTNGGLTLAGSAFSILLDTASALVLGAGGIKVDRSVVVTKYAADCAATTNPQTFTHLLGSNDIEVTVYEVSTGNQVIADVQKGAGTAIVDFGGAPTAAQYRVVIQA